MLKALGFLKLMLHIAMLNAKSIRQKVCCLIDSITDRGLDLWNSRKSAMPAELQIHRQKPGLKKEEGWALCIDKI